MNFQMNMTCASKQPCKLSHKQFRALLKKFKRKKKRQQLAQEREHLELLEQQKRENSPNFKEREEDRRRNSQLYEEFEERERLRRHKEWLLREELAQIQFRKKQEQLRIENERREAERKRILEEFEKQQYIENKAEEENQKLKSQKEVIVQNNLHCGFSKHLGCLQHDVLQEALANLPEDGPWHNPIAPEHFNTGQEQTQCQFFAKTGCCRFGERCSRGHIHPSVSTTILIKGMFTHFSIDHTGRDDYDTDMALEYEDKETYQDFKTFYNDVLPEFKKFGKVIQFKVCNNHEAHLRGNVYVQYSKENEAVEAYKSFNGRYYAGKQITCEFTHVIKWRSAICGLYFRKQCPKGINCNFLHVFRNPSDEFWEANRDMSLRESTRSSYSHRNHYSRHDSDRYSHRTYSSERHSYRDVSPEQNRNYYTPSNHRRSSESDSEKEYRENSRHSRHKSKKDRKESSRSHHKHKHRDSRSKSCSPYSEMKETETSNNHKRNKYKKKKKKSKKKHSDESDSS